MRSRFSINGHPLHPLFVTAPIGLFVWGFISLLIYVGRNYDATWYDISLWSIIPAIVTALIAALFGFGDYFTMALRTDARMIATAHMILNLLMVIAFLIAAILMSNDAARQGSRLVISIVLQGIGTGLLALSGVLGGEMVYRHHLAMIPEDAAVAQDQERRHHERPHMAH